MSVHGAAAAGAGSEPAGDDDQGPVPARGRLRRRRRRRRAALAVLVVGLLLAGSGLVWVERQVDPGRAGPAVTVNVPPGATTDDIAGILAKRGVVANATLFRLYVRARGAGRFQAGEYTLRRHEPYAGALTTLRKGPEITVQRLTVPEGLTLAQIAERVGRMRGRSAAVFLQVARSGAVRSRYEQPGSTNLEGLLFPDTYDFQAKEDEQAILTRMVRAFETVADRVGLEQAPARVGLAPYQVVTLASMVEREAKVPDDRAMIARVIYNRLGKGIPLGVDATLRYGLDRPTQPLRESDLATASPYNTRLVAGLPPTPIASPGRAALAAGLDPAPGPWLYYVLADASGRHAFSTTKAEFDRDVAACRAKGLC